VLTIVFTKVGNTCTNTIESVFTLHSDYIPPSKTLVLTDLKHVTRYKTKMISLEIEKRFLWVPWLKDFAVYNTSLHSKVIC